MDSEPFDKNVIPDHTYETSLPTQQKQIQNEPEVNNPDASNSDDEVPLKFREAGH